jgi:hypothetical protein
MGRLRVAVVYAGNLILVFFYGIGAAEDRLYRIG